MRKTILAILMLTAASLTACKKEIDTPNETNTGNGNNNGNGIAPGGCYPTNCDGYICTAQFAEVIPEVNDGIGNPVNADSFVVVNLAGIPLPPAPNILPVYGYPTVATASIR